jgi:hypothetical protein
LEQRRIIETRSPRSFDVVSSAGDLLIAAQVELLKEAVKYGSETVLALYQGLDEQLRAETLARSPEEVRSMIRQGLGIEPRSLFTVDKFAG